METREGLAGSGLSAAAVATAVDLPVGATEEEGAASLVGEETAAAAVPVAIGKSAICPV